MWEPQSVGTVSNRKLPEQWCSDQGEHEALVRLLQTSSLLGIFPGILVDALVWRIALEPGSQVSSRTSLSTRGLYEKITPLLLFYQLLCVYSLSSDT